MRNARVWTCALLFLATLVIVVGCTTAASQTPVSPTLSAVPTFPTVVPSPLAQPTRAPAATETPATKTVETPVRGDIVNPASIPPQLLEQARADLARRLGLPAESFEIKSANAVEWPDSSLGCPKPGFMYSQIVTPGFLIVLAANGKEYEYHTDASRVVLCEK